MPNNRKKKEAENVQGCENDAGQERQTQQMPQPEQPEAQEQAADPQAIISELTKKSDEYLQVAQRTLADFENYKRRNEAVKTQAYCDGVTDALTAILPVLDNFDRAVAAIEVNESSKAILDGILMVKKQLESVLSGKGVCEICSSKGEKFDPALHNAVMTAPPEEGFEAGSIASTFQKGYKLNDKVIRYAMVSVFNE